MDSKSRLNEKPHRHLQQQLRVLNRRNVNHSNWSKTYRTFTLQIWVVKYNGKSWKVAAAMETKSLLSPKIHRTKLLDLEAIRWESFLENWRNVCTTMASRNVRKWLGERWEWSGPKGGFRVNRIAYINGALAAFASSYCVSGHRRPSMKVWRNTGNTFYLWRATRVMHFRASRTTAAVLGSPRSYSLW